MKNAIIALGAGVIMGLVGVAGAAVIGSQMKNVDTLEFGNFPSRQTIVKIVDQENGATCYVYSWVGISCIGTSTVAR